MESSVTEILLVLTKINEKVSSTSARWKKPQVEGSQGAFHRIWVLVNFLLWNRPSSTDTVRCQKTATAKHAQHHSLSLAQATYQQNQGSWYC